MNELKIFNYHENQIRTIQKDGEPWFILKDVCQVLGISKYRDVVDRLDADERAPVKVDTLGGAQEMIAVNESGLYNVILRSDKPEARPFRKWVTSEVLPSIRRHGAYMTPEALEAAIYDPDYLLRVITVLKEETDRRKALEAANASLSAENEIMAPKAEYFDQLCERNTLTNFRETAKELGIPPKKFVQYLIDKKYVYRDQRRKLLPYEQQNNGLFVVKEAVNENNAWSGTQTLVTPKGRETFRLLCRDM